MNGTRTPRVVRRSIRRLTACRSTSAASTPNQPPVIRLDDPLALDATLAGAKAASLARAAGHCLPVLPGFVLTTAGVGADGGIRRGVEGDLRSAWSELSGDGASAVVVRSSSTVEDGESTSMAGMFTSVLDVRGWAAFLDAVSTVLASTKAVPGIEMAPMAVLVQPMLQAQAGGVMFGADPVTGRRDRLVVAAVEGGPDQLVSGSVDGSHYVLSRRGGLLEVDEPLPILTRPRRRQLAGLAAAVAQAFGSPQDVEWAIGGDGQLRLLQSRPITTGAVQEPGQGPILGPGPVAETFPDALSALEADLWLPPLHSALSEALRLTGSASRRQITASPVLTAVAGRVAADLELLGVAPVRRSFFARFDPRPPARRLGAAWRVGRLRAALPSLGADLVADVDRQLLTIPALRTLDDAALVGLLRRSHQALVALHGHEVLTGLLVTNDESSGSTNGASITGASAALRVLARERAQGRADHEIVVDHPVVLALVAPKVQAASELPPSPAIPTPVAGPAGPGGVAASEAVAGPAGPGGVAASEAVTGPAGGGGTASPLATAYDAALLREALRMRVRWVHELTARAAWELGTRLAVREVLETPGAVRHLTLDQLESALEGSSLGVMPTAEQRPDTPLPAAFRLGRQGEVVEVATPTDGDSTGRGAGGGRGVGIVHEGDEMPSAGAILVVRSLDPQLATNLPHLGGLVAETGSVLSHLAILAREFGVPTVVGVPDALRRFPAGSKVLVDGSSGLVELLKEPASPEAPSPGHNSTGTPHGTAATTTGAAA